MRKATLFFLVTFINLELCQQLGQIWHSLTTIVLEPLKDAFEQFICIFEVGDRDGLHPTRSFEKILLSQTSSFPIPNRVIKDLFCNVVFFEPKEHHKECHTERIDILRSKVFIFFVLHLDFRSQIEGGADYSLGFD